MPGMTRRHVIRALGIGAGLTVAAPLLAACGGAASPTAAPAAKPTEAKPAAPAEPAAPAPKPTAAPAALPTPAAATAKAVPDLIGVLRDTRQEIELRTRIMFALRPQNVTLRKMPGVKDAFVRILDEQ